MIIIPSCILISSTFIFIAILTNIKIAFFIIFNLLANVFHHEICNKKQAILSKYLSKIRSAYSADLTDRISGILEIFISNNNKFHFSRGIRTQKKNILLQRLKFIF